MTWRKLNATIPTAPGTLLYSHCSIHIFLSQALHMPNEMIKSKPRFRLAAPIAIPLVSLLTLYAISLCIYLAHRRRKREKRDKEDATPHQDVNRNGSVDSAITVQTVTESEDGIKSKPSLWLITRPPEEQNTTTSEILEDQDRIVEPVSRGDRSTVQSPV